MAWEIVPMSDAQSKTTIQPGDRVQPIMGDLDVGFSWVVKSLGEIHGHPVAHILNGGAWRLDCLRKVTSHD